jgi:hypothetical protein
MVVGLPRSKLVTSKSDVAPFTPDRAAPLAFAPFVAPAAPVGGGEATLREPMLLGDPHRVEGAPPPPPRASYPSAISTNELLERAAALGPARTTWESIVLPADPILDRKRQPHVAERRERFTRMVKVGLGACVAVCVVALGVGALSADASSSSAASASSSSVALSKTVPSKGIVPVEALDRAKHAKAVRQIGPTVATAAIRAKRR